MTAARPPLIGPVLVLDDIGAAALRLSALFITDGDEGPPPVETSGGAYRATVLARFDRATVWRARFDLLADRPAEYRWNGETYPVACDLRGDLRIAFVSCNGEEADDLEREGSERNAMWARLGAAHRAAPFALLLHGGDQVYADEITQGHRLSEDWPSQIPPEPSPADLSDLRHHLRERLLDRYAALYAAPEFAWIAARVPSLMQWDDHDICDGWGSLRRWQTHSAVGQTLFSVARECFLVFQQAAVEGDLPPRFHDPAGHHLGWRVRAPGLRILAPDLRSERTRRSILGAGGWAMMDAEAAAPPPGSTLLVSSVPLLGPRLSVLETLMVAIPRMQKYEDDLRDQWQSRAHRAEWQRMLRLVRDMTYADGRNITVLSGEIHLATRAVMELERGLAVHQLVASGIAHRAPPAAWARVLGSLARLGEAPLARHPIRIGCLPGRRRRYVAERNYLMLERRSDSWSAAWDLEHSGATPDLPL
ncbi:alkaline phosphatase D family protein [Hyphomonas sp. GM-8P]|uniref:alkaline phosphatase D family protein n=1 Tax=Alphaproteobacteria TaxID=28211 RepID=UPI000DD4D4BA|nr:alkaline phosphatase D family protein [Hyphomonas sp. GM-8P]MBO6690036.1 alkaline phosphatase family protein [Henriciella sp.]|tara:strand:+ start:13356 stop:14789 length:1434 start_codon:yes stop_codon:yes gene_type:complete